MKHYLLHVTKKNDSRTIVEMAFLAVLFQEWHLYQISLKGATYQGHRFIV